MGTLDDDFFSTEDEDPHRRSILGFPFQSPPNGTAVFLSGFHPSTGFSQSIPDNGLLLHRIIRPDVVFRYPSVESGDENEKETDYDDPNRHLDRENDYQEEKNGKELEKIVDFRMFLKGLELGRRDAAALFFLVSFLSAAYGWVILGFTAIYSWVLGVVFVTVINDLIGRFCSFFGIVWDGSRLGLKRVTGFILMRWAVRDALTQLLGLWYFGEIEDQYSFLRLFVRLKLMPFSVMSPWIRGFEKETSGFLFTWFLLDTFVGFVFAVDAWVAIVDSRRTGREIVKEGCYLISTMLNQAIQLKCFEAILCGSFARWILARVFWKYFAAVFQSAMEVYFMVAWLIFYLAARCKDAHMEGRRFGRRELEGLVDGQR